MAFDLIKQLFGTVKGEALEHGAIADSVKAEAQVLVDEALAPAKTALLSSINVALAKYPTLAAVAEFSGLETELNTLISDFNVKL
jgi:hypothetical protein